MTKKKRTIHETLTTVPVIETGAKATPTTEEDPAFTALRTTLAEVNKLEGATGYILRNATSAVIDLKDPSNLVAYALISSQAADSAQEFSEMFDLGDVESTVLEGGNAKVLCVTADGSKASVFMEKTVDHTKILRRILH